MVKNLFSAVGSTSAEMKNEQCMLSLMLTEKESSKQLNVTDFSAQ